MVFFYVAVLLVLGFNKAHAEECDMEIPGSCHRHWMIRRYLAFQTTLVTTSPYWPHGVPETPTLNAGATLGGTSDVDGWGVLRVNPYTGFALVDNAVPADWVTNTTTGPYSFGMDATDQYNQWGFEGGPYVVRIDVGGTSFCYVYDATHTILVAAVPTGTFTDPNSLCVGIVVTSDGINEKLYLRTVGNGISSVTVSGTTMHGSFTGSIGSNNVEVYLRKDTYTDFEMTANEVEYEFFELSDMDYREYAHECFGIPCNMSNVCSEHGQCTDLNTCVCCSNWTGAQCDVPVCYGLGATDPEVCSGHGGCGVPNICVCDVDYAGDNCEIWDCYGENITAACHSPNGTCANHDDCVCLETHEGDECEDWLCNGIVYSLPGVCSGNGQCTQKDNCLCDAGWGGNDCEIQYCYGVIATDPDTCSGRGVCDDLDTCECFVGWGGDQCRDRLEVCDIAGVTNPNSTVNSTYYMRQNFNLAGCGPTTTFSENWHFSTLVGTSSTGQIDCLSGPYGFGGTFGTLDTILPHGADIDSFLDAVVERGVYLRFALDYDFARFRSTEFDLYNGMKVHALVSMVDLSTFLTQVTIFDSEGGEIIKYNPPTFNPVWLNVYVYHDGIASYVYLYNEVVSEPPTAGIYGTSTSAPMVHASSDRLHIGISYAVPDTRLMAFGLSLGPVSHSEALTIVQGGMPSYTVEGDYLCFGRYGDDPGVCSGNGACIDKDTCRCCPGYEGANCDIPVECDGIDGLSPLVCNQKGDCIHTDHCYCYGGWYGELCQYSPFPKCYGISINDTAACGPNGTCIAQDSCECDIGWAGGLCDVEVCPLRNPDILEVLDSMFVGDVITADGQFQI